MAKLDVKALCAYALECCERDPTETWLVLLRLANAGVTAFEVSTYLEPDEMRKIVQSIRKFGGEA